MIDAFPGENDRLTYGRRKRAEAITSVIDGIEQGLVPRVDDFMSKFELEVWDGVQRQLGVVLLDFREFQLTAPRVGNALWLCLTR